MFFMFLYNLNAYPLTKVHYRLHDILIYST